MTKKLREWFYYIVWCTNWQQSHFDLITNWGSRTEYCCFSQGLITMSPPLSEQAADLLSSIWVIFHHHKHSFLCVLPAKYSNFLLPLRPNHREVIIINELA